MGIGSFLKKAFKTVTGGVLGHAFKPISGVVKDALGLNAFEDVAKGQDAAMQQQAEAMKLQQANAFSNVVQFEDGGSNVGGNDMRQKKRQTGAYSSLGLNT